MAGEAVCHSGDPGRGPALGAGRRLGCPIPPRSQPRPLAAARPSLPGVCLTSRKTLHREKSLPTSFPAFWVQQTSGGYGARFGVSRTPALVSEGRDRNTVILVSSSQDRQPCVPGGRCSSEDLGFLLLGVSRREAHRSINQLCG